MAVLLITSALDALSMLMTGEVVMAVLLITSRLCWMHCLC